MHAPSVRSSTHPGSICDHIRLKIQAMDLGGLMLERPVHHIDHVDRSRGVHVHFHVVAARADVSATGRASCKSPSMS